MKLTPELLAEFKAFWKKDYGEDLTDLQAQEYGDKLVGFFELLLKIDMRIQGWNERLKNDPQGFAFPEDGTYQCCVCRDSISNKSGWYDEYRMKCSVCQDALNQGVIPHEVCTDSNSWYSSYAIQNKLGIHSATLRKKVRTGELEARVIGKNHCLIFLKSENPQLQ